MQRPVLKDGIVVNVVEIGDDTLIVTKARHKEMMAAEDEEYQQQLSAWRKTEAEHRAEIQRAIDAIGMLSATLSAFKAKAAEAGKKGTNAQAAITLQQILSTESEIEIRKKSIAELRAKPLPIKPKLVRTKRWFHPDGLECGPAGGNIGDLWDGKTYTRPEKPKVEAPAEKAVV